MEDSSVVRALLFEVVPPTMRARKRPAPGLVLFSYPLKLPAPWGSYSFTGI